MYFSTEGKFKFSKYINSDYKFYAHIVEKKNEGGYDRKEILEEHLLLAEEYLYKIFKAKNLESIFENLENRIFNIASDSEKQLFREMLSNLIFMHDVGKLNPNFQDVKMKNKLGILGLVGVNYSNHSMLSAVIYINYYFKKIKKLSSENRNIFINIMIMNAYVISKHHGSLDSMEEFKNKLKEKDGEGYRLIENKLAILKDIYCDEFILTNSMVEKIFAVNNKYVNKLNNDEKITNYIYEKLIFSLLLACDYYSTTEFMNNKKISSLGELSNIDEFYEAYKNTEVSSWIREYEKKDFGNDKDFSKVKDINILRNEMFLEAEKNFEENINSRIAYLEAPTGGGKSNIAMNLSFKTIEKDSNVNKIIYVYPFNTLVEQNMNNINKVFGENKKLINKISVINSLVPIKRTDNDGEEAESYEALLNRQFLHYPMILTTHISLFNYLFGVSKEDSFPLIHLVNSVIVLDEIQSYKNILWKEIIIFLKSYSEILNIKLIIMSATLPNLSKLIGTEEGTVRLIKNPEKYFKSPIFKNRVELDFKFLESSDVVEELFSHIKSKAIDNDKKIVIEFIKKSSAYNFYNKLKADNDIESEVLLMTGDDNSIDREEILDKVKENKSMILVATQVIEAGVDIDMDIGYKDISILDSDEQFLGRINRSCKKVGSKVYFFNLDAAESIYKRDIRRNQCYTLVNEEMREVLKNKEFAKFYEGILEDIIVNTTRINDDNIDKFIHECIGGLNFKEVKDRMQLIDDDKNETTIFLSRVIKLKDKSIVDGDRVWEEFIEILQDEEMEFAKKKIRLSEIRSKMSYFIYKIRGNKDFTYSDKVGKKRLGEIYFISDGERFFENGKFNKDSFISGSADII